MNTSASADFSTRRTPSRAGCRMSLNRLERWSIVGMSQARRRLSGMFVGPGMKTGFCRLIWVSPHLSPITLARWPAAHNFFEIVFQKC